MLSMIWRVVDLHFLRDYFLMLVSIGRSVSGIPRKGFPTRRGWLVCLDRSVEVLSARQLKVFSYRSRIYHTLHQSKGNRICSCRIRLQPPNPIAQKPAPRAHMQQGLAVKPVFPRLLVLAEGGLSTVLFLSSWRNYLACTLLGRPHAVANVRW